MIVERDSYVEGYRSGMENFRREVLSMLGHVSQGALTLEVYIEQLKQLNFAKDDVPEKEK